MSTEKIYDATVRQITAHFPGERRGERIRHLDIGSGSGDLMKSAFLKLFILWPFIKFFSTIIWYKEVNRYKTIDDSNREIVAALNSLPVLLGRTVVVSGLKSDRGMSG